MLKKHVLIVGVVFCLVAVNSAFAEEKIELHVFHFKQNLEEQWNSFTDEYSNQFPHISFRNEILGGGTNWQPILQGKFAAGEGPDIFIVEGPSQAGGSQLSGRTPQNRVVNFQGPPQLVGEEIPVLVTKAHAHSLEGVVCLEANASLKVVKERSWCGK